LYLSNNISMYYFTLIPFAYLSRIVFVLFGQTTIPMLYALVPFSFTFQQMLITSSFTYANFNNYFPLIFHLQLPHLIPFPTRLPYTTNINKVIYKSHHPSYCHPQLLTQRNIGYIQPDLLLINFKQLIESKHELE